MVALRLPVHGSGMRLKGLMGRMNMSCGKKKAVRTFGDCCRVLTFIISMWIASGNNNRAFLDICNS